MTPPGTATIPCRPPFDLQLSLRFLCGFSPMEGEQQIRDGELAKPIVVQGRTIVFHVRQDPTVPGLTLDCRPGTAVPEVTARVAFMLSVDEDMEPFHAMAARDRELAPVAARLRGLHHVKFPSAFEAGCWAVLNQRVRLETAQGWKRAVARAAGGGGGAFPEADAVAALGFAGVLGAVRDERKARAVLAVAEAFARVREEELRTAPLDEVEAWLRGIYGVGELTSGFVLFRGLGRFLRLPTSPQFLEIARRVLGVRPTELARRVASYGPWGGHVALYLWASTFV